MEKGDYLVLLFGNLLDFIIVFFGVLKVGIVVVFINLLYMFIEIGYMLINGDVKVIVGVDQFLLFYESMYELLLKVEFVILCQMGDVELEVLDLEVRMKMIMFVKILCLIFVVK